MYNADGMRPVVLGVCAMDIKARSKAMREILTRLVQLGPVEVKIFGDKVILDEGELPNHYSLQPALTSRRPSDTP